MKSKKAVIKKRLKKVSKKFVPMTMDQLYNAPTGMTRAFSNNRFIVMIYDNHSTSKGGATLAMIRNIYESPIVFHWKELQNIKNELFGEETTAVEYYPKESELIDDKNIYWLWVYPEEVLPIPILK